jgi:hypothetical protein
MPEQKGWTGLGPKTPKPPFDLKQKKRRPAVFPFKVAGSWPKRAGNQVAAPRYFPQRLFDRLIFPGRDCAAPPPPPPPCVIWAVGRGSWPSNGNAPIKMREKTQRACAWPFSVPDGFYLKWALEGSKTYNREFRAKQGLLYTRYTSERGYNRQQETRGFLPKCSHGPWRWGVELASRPGFPHLTFLEPGTTYFYYLPSSTLLRSEIGGFWGTGALSKGPAPQIPKT